MSLLVATIISADDRRSMFQIQLEDTGRNGGIWKLLERNNTMHFQWAALPPSGTAPFPAGEGPWAYFPKTGGLLFMVDTVGPFLRANQVMAFLHVRWDFLTFCGCTACKGAGAFGDAARNFPGPSRDLVWVLGPGLGVCKPSVPRPTAVGVTSDPHRSLSSPKVRSSLGGDITSDPEAR
jgi:hypothetical protein